nr:GNAT family protein [Actinospica durhamensis]
MSPWARGSGVAAEATAVVARWLLAEQHFERLELRAAVENVASCKTAVRAGFQREGVLRNAGFVHSGRIDVVVFSRIRGDLDPAADPGESEAAHASAGAAQPLGTGG